MSWSLLAAHCRVPRPLGILLGTQGIRAVPGRSKVFLLVSIMIVLTMPLFTSVNLSVITEAYVTDPGVAKQPAKPRKQLENWLSKMVLPAKENIPISAITDLFLEIDRMFQLLARWPRSPRRFLVARRGYRQQNF